MLCLLRLFASRMARFFIEFGPGSAYDEHRHVYGKHRFLFIITFNVIYTSKYGHFTLLQVC